MADDMKYPEKTGAKHEHDGFATPRRLVKTAPMATRYMDVLYRTYGWYNVAFGVITTIIAVTAFRRGDEGDQMAVDSCR